MSHVDRLEPRAGFWRRAIGYSIDGLIVALLAAVIVAIPIGLFYTASNGAIQFGPSPSILEAEDGSGFHLGEFSLIQCANVDLAQLPTGLDPPPPADATSAVDCRNFVFGLLETGRELTVWRVTKEGNVTKGIARSYVLGADGKPREAVSLDWLTSLLFFIYLVTLQSRFGATLGMRPVHIRVVETEAPRQGRIPLAKAVLRNVLILAGVVPILAMLVGAFIAHHGIAEAMFNFSWFLIMLLAAGLFAIAYYLWILIDVVGKKDPIYDRIAGTAVLRSLH